MLAVVRGGFFSSPVHSSTVGFFLCDRLNSLYSRLTWKIATV